MRRNVLNRIASLEAKMAPAPNRFMLFCDELFSRISFVDHEESVRIQDVPEAERTESQTALLERVQRVFVDLCTPYTIEELEQIAADCPPG